jgi:two-component system CheB/CheR fusion protein
MNGIPVKSSAQTSKLKYFPVVAIGASAGGIEAMVELLKSLPENTGMAYVYIQHLDPERESMLTEILGRNTSMPVLEAREGLKVKADHLYIIPPNREMTVEEGTLKLSMRPAKPQIHLPINQFFISLAENYKEKSIGILLSGNPPDGTLGLKSIKAAGGITFAQDGTASFSGMPRNAIAEEAADLVLSPKRMAEELVKLSDQQEKYDSAIHKINTELISDRDENLVQVIRMVNRFTGVDFSHYKINTIKRRIVRRMIIHRIETLEDYVVFLKEQGNEVHQLYQDLLINVTTFFRDAESAEYLKKTLYPKIVKSKSPGEPIRIWVPACSTGQEAYSQAIMMVEVFGEKAAGIVQIFATDLSELAINKARLGIYSKDEVVDVAPARLNRFFTKIDGSYRIVKSIRDLCIFATHNVLRDPPFSKLDVISCCNLMIYLEAVLQKKVMSTFHYALNNNSGYLVLGKSETIGSSSYLFSQVDKKYKIYAKKKDAAAKALFELSFRGVDEKGGEITARTKAAVRENKTEEMELDRIVDQVLLKKYTPACVVVNQDLDIVQFRGSTGLFLEPSPGKASLNLMKMARAGLAFELRNIVYKASKSGQAEEKTWSENAKDGKIREISIEAVPFQQQTDSIEKYFLVVFDERFVLSPDAIQANLTKDKKVKQLEDELTSLREDMRSILEEQEAANEELQSVNEEIVSSNEELQSINEELETSKEELESSNEELVTINQELQMRNEQLAEIQEYTEAIFSTIREALIILDKNLRIKNVNSTFYKIFGVSEEETTGQLLYDLGNGQWNIPRLKELLEEIIPRNAEINDFEVTHHFPVIGEKTMMLNAKRLMRKLHGENVILLAFEDITTFRKAQKVIAEREAWFKNMADNSPMMIWVADAAKKIAFVNKSWLDYRDTTFQDVIGKDWIEEMHPDDDRNIRHVFEESFENKKPFTARYRIRANGKFRLILSKGKPDYTHEGHFAGFIGSCVELPENGTES